MDEILRGLSKPQLTALTSLVIEVINADDKVEPAEFLLVNDLCARLNITEQMYDAAMRFDPLLAIETLKPLRSEQIIAIAHQLISAAEADGVLAREEQAVLRAIFHLLEVNKHLHT